MNSENENERKIAKNTKGIIFCSTPHRGSQTALIKDLTALLVWPTIEVQELKESKKIFTLQFLPIELPLIFRFRFSSPAKIR